MYQTINQPTNQAINQSINQPISQSVNQPTNQLINQSINQSINYQSINFHCTISEKSVTAVESLSPVFLETVTATQARGYSGGSEGQFEGSHCIKSK